MKFLFLLFSLSIYVQDLSAQLNFPYSFDNNIKSKTFLSLSNNSISDAYLSELTEMQLYVLRNAFWAEKSYFFKTKLLSEYFSKFDWYVPKENEIKLSESETEIIQKIMNFAKTAFPEEGYNFLLNQNDSIATVNSSKVIAIGIDTLAWVVSLSPKQNKLRRSNDPRTVFKGSGWIEVVKKSNKTFELAKHKVDTRKDLFLTMGLDGSFGIYPSNKSGIIEPEIYELEFEGKKEIDKYLQNFWIENFPPMSKITIKYYEGSCCCAGDCSKKEKIINYDLKNNMIF